MAVHRRHRRGRRCRAGRRGPDAISPRPSSCSAADVIWRLPATLIKGEARTWPSPFDAAMRDLRALRGRRVCVLASGDPFLHGVGATIARLVPADEIAVIPAPSAFSLAAARLGWPLAEIETVSLHGKPVELLRPLLHPGRRVLALTSDENGPPAVAALLAGCGFGGSTLTRAGGAGRRPRAHPHRAAPTASRSTASIRSTSWRSKWRPTPDAPILPLAPGLADDLFEHDGQITKREIRPLTLSALAPRRGELLWDIGAGAGSVAIEWMLADPSMRAIAIEVDPDRAARIRRNATALGVPGLSVVEGAAPAALAGLPRPDAIFIGGGGSDDGRARSGDRCACLRRTAGRQRGDAGDGGDPARPSCQARRRPCCASRCRAPRRSARCMAGGRQCRSRNGRG